MAQSIPPVRQPNLGGVFTGGNVFRRPPDTAVRCHNFRPMPGGGIRLRGGWQRRAAGTTGVSHLQFHEFRKGSLSGGISHLVQTTQSAGDKWHSIDLSTYTKTELFTVAGGQKNRVLAKATVRDRVFLDNGLGTRDASYSKPALSSWDGTTVRYVGLDAYCPGGSNPTASFAVGAGNNNIAYGIDIYVGLYNATTNHYSNGVFAGSLTTAGAGTITVSNLTRLVYASNNATEASELYYVFYATGDGLKVPYLILNAAGTDVHKVAAGTASASLSLTASDTKGFFFSNAHEMPKENFPPRPMKELCYANGRLYGVLQSGGTGAAVSYGIPDDRQDRKNSLFSYIVTDREAAAVVYSAAADDYVDQTFVGVPEESWPLTNKKYIPNGETAILLSDLANRGQVLVLTATGSFYLEQTVDGLHVWQRISENRGILDKRTYVKTPRGPMWVTQHLEIVLLDESSMTLETLSDNYSELLAPPNYSGGTFGVAADYLLDPVNAIDRYQVWTASGWFACHDFWLERDQQRRGVTVAPAWSGEVYAITAARTMRDSSGQTHHIVAGEAIWTQEGQPETRYVSTRDENASGVWADVSEGDWIGQWLDFGDPRVRKEIQDVQVITDGEYSGQLGRRPIQVLWYGDLEYAHGDTWNEATVDKTDQSDTDLSYIAKIGSNLKWLKLRLKLAGHSGDSIVTTFPYAQSYAGEISLAVQIYGSIAEAAVTANGGRQNR